jgi:hypothetical protein
MKTKIILIILIVAFTSCQSIKDGLSGRKSENSDEFLVQKKNPLVLPPDYLKLPKPDESVEDKNQLEIIEEETDIQNILNVKQVEQSQKTKNFGDAEEFILENIK